MLLQHPLHIVALSANATDPLNLVRYLGNELRIPIVCLGTKDAYLAVRTDDQLENRFHPFLLPRWEDDAELGRLLVSFEAMLPLCEPPHLGSPAMRTLVIRRSEGTIGEVAMLLVQTATTALLAGRFRCVGDLRASCGPPSPHQATRPMTWWMKIRRAEMSLAGAAHTWWR